MIVFGWNFDSETTLKIWCKSFLEYLGIKEEAKVDFGLIGSFGKIGVVLAGKMEVIFEVKSLINLLSLLKAWETGQESLNAAVEAWFLRYYPCFFTVYMAIVLKNNYLFKLIDFLDLELWKLEKRVALVTLY